MLEFFGAVITAVRRRFSETVVGVALASVAGTTGFISYTHISALTEHLGQSWKTAHLMPFAVDGQIVIGSVYYMENEGKRRRWLGLIGFVPGVAESLFANWESGIVHGLLAAGWSTVPAQAFACSTILFDLWLHARKAQAEAAQDSAPEAEAAAGQPESETVPQAPEPVAPAAQEPGPVRVHLHAAPEGAPWGLVSPAAAPAEPEPVPVMTIPTVGPFMTLADRPKPAAARRKPVQAVPDAGEERLPLPADEDALRSLVNSMTRNDLYRQYQVSKHQADKLRQQYLNEEEVA
jgi:hypothetical protein